MPNLVNLEHIHPDGDNDRQTAEQTQKLARAEPFRQVTDGQLNNGPADDEQAEKQADFC